MSDPRPVHSADLTQLLRTALRVAPPGCPDVARLQAVDPTHADGVAAHVAGCPRCRAIAAALDVPDEPLAASPRAAALRARALRVYRDSPLDLLRLAVRAVAGRLEVLELVGAVLEPRPVRGATPDGLMVHRQIDDSLAVQAHVGYSPRGGFAILLDMLADPTPEPPLRVTMWRDGRELASDIARGGRAAFSSLRPGRYRMHIGGQGAELVGRIDLDLEAEAAVP